MPAHKPFCRALYRQQVTCALRWERHHRSLWDSFGHFPKTTLCNSPSTHWGTFQSFYLVFSVEVVVENAKVFPSVAASVGSTNEVFYYQSNVDERYFVAREKSVLQQRTRIHSFFSPLFLFPGSRKATHLTYPSLSLQYIVTKFQERIRASPFATAQVNIT